MRVRNSGGRPLCVLRDGVPPPRLLDTSAPLPCLLDLRRSLLHHGQLPLHPAAPLSPPSSSIKIDSRLPPLHLAAPRPLPPQDCLAQQRRAGPPRRKNSRFSCGNPSIYYLFRGSTPAALRKFKQIWGKSYRLSPSYPGAGGQILGEVPSYGRFVRVIPAMPQRQRLVWSSCIVSRGGEQRKAAAAV